MTHDDMMEKIARDIALEMGGDPDYGVPDRGRIVPFWKTSPMVFAKIAFRRTLEAIREPSEGMKDAAYDCMGAEAGADYPSPETSWAAMIDHLLNAKPTVEDERLAVLENK